MFAKYSVTCMLHFWMGWGEGRNKLRKSNSSRKA